ncbi:MAG: aspartate/tyrosine/aromatic aminotransferase [Pirellulales bacterium]|nr:aspartate/tyrosine/aromatic aminotransferase [Pirellulales bacterium]
MTASADSKTDQHFGNLTTAPPDAILGLTEAFVADPHPNKMNLSVGVYKDATGQTPILKCVKEAEKRLVESEATKGYLPIDGHGHYREHVRKLIFGDTIDADRVVVLQTPGGTGALRVAADFLATQLAPARLWTPSPTWANHPAVLAASGLATQSYRYLAADRTSLDFDGMMEDLRQQASAGDVVLLHACCHNPTGVDPTLEQWRQLAALISDQGLLPLIDFAYQGFGSGLEEDAAGLRMVLEATGEAIVCSSFSKNFGLYSERVGAISLLASGQSQAKAVQSQLKKVVRCNYSSPPRHGGAIVATVLEDEDLTRIWHQELDQMRQRITNLRTQFVETMKATGAGHDFSFLLSQRGMFSFSGLNQMQVDQLKSKHSIYVVGSGRINVAGMSEERMDWFCQAVAEVLES